MNAFKTYKACLPIPWSPNLYITLVRSIPEDLLCHTPIHKKKGHDTAILLPKTASIWNTPTVRGMLRQEMFKACKEEANHRALCLPLVISHLPAPDCSS
ncbi:hypothetical protein ACJRO7_010162 [Eucalyptus globulus]|uniref:Uncharacterized protein n=1 Tax=Eucalyptus globulus TaxID=34317 RepID=A0ABD3LB66_EUCGL